MSGSASLISLFILPQDEGESLVGVQILWLDSFEQMGKDSGWCENVVTHYSEEFIRLRSLQ